VRSMVSVLLWRPLQGKKNDRGVVPPILIRRTQDTKDPVTP
jgi:hypothetical protein